MAADELVLPRALVAAAREEGRNDWLQQLPALVARFAGEWSLSVAAPFQPGGQCAWVAPALTAGGDDLVLKVAWRHTEADHEADALRVWDGDGAVRLHAVAEEADTIVLLLERCRPGRALSEAAEEDQDLVISRALRRLWIEPPAHHRFRPLAEMCARWAAQFDIARDAGRVRIDAGLASEGIALFRTLPATAERHVLLCTDLHAGNVLSAVREPWLVVDPKPYVGDPAYDVIQHMLNCSRRLHADPLGMVARLAGMLDLDGARVRQWVFARCVQESVDWPELGEVARRVGSS